VSLLKKIAQLGLQTLTNQLEVQRQQTPQSVAPRANLQSGSRFKLERNMIAEHPRTGQTVYYYSVLDAKISVCEPGSALGQRFDLTRQREGRWIKLNDAILACTQGNHVLIEWLP
jgi:hypothetical protein